ncbi:hypothetical protein BP5796_12485 [Coleophoma crateriformis]|uniref:Uncharacterized protein n=1 Tax=Coleophoma crateriformis TaxID=565419 RepID=A0A3D8Q8B8_9HELO|nr:hypothetical protein BP5796_12485 [Coleophoma crateriformis]
MSSIKPSHSEIDHITAWYREDDCQGMEAADARRRHDMVAEWYKWCDCEYPGTEYRNWKHLVSAAGEDVDIRLLTMAHPFAAYAILLFLEACYAIDKALCGMDMEALAMVKKWHAPQEMKAYKYLLSEEMRLWWATELCELENEIKSPFSNRVSLSWRINDLRSCLARLEGVIDYGEGIGTNIWTTMAEENAEPPAGVDDAVYDRYNRLKTSVEILCAALERTNQGVVGSDMLPSNEHKIMESGGIRKRIPRAASSAIDEHNPRSIIHEDNNPSSSSIPVNSLPGTATTTSPGLRHLRSTLKLIMAHFRTKKIRYKTTGILEWFIHRETAFIVSLCFVVVSVFLMAWSVILAKSQSATPYTTSPPSDPNFLGNLSQSILSNLSIYLMIATTVHNQPEGLRYQSWIWICLFGSSLSSVLGLGLYSAIPVASIVFLWVAAFAQVVVPVLLMVTDG